jgi:hypothetical protein
MKKQKRVTLVPSDDYYKRAKKNSLDVYGMAANSSKRRKFTLVNAPFHEETYKMRDRAGKHAQGLTIPTPPFRAAKNPEELIRFFGVIN